MKIVRLRYTWVLREKRPGGVGGGRGACCGCKNEEINSKKITVTVKDLCKPEEY